MQPQEKVRRMRSGTRHPGRSTDGARKNYHTPDVTEVSPAPELILILVTDINGDLTAAYIAYIEQEQGQENKP